MPTGQLMAANLQWQFHKTESTDTTKHPTAQDSIHQQRNNKLSPKAPLLPQQTHTHEQKSKMGHGSLCKSQHLGAWGRRIIMCLRIAWLTQNSGDSVPAAHLLGVLELQSTTLSALIWDSRVLSCNANILPTEPLHQSIIFLRELCPVSHMTTHESKEVHSDFQNIVLWLWPQISQTNMNLEQA